MRESQKSHLLVLYMLVITVLPSGFFTPVTRHYLKTRTARYRTQQTRPIDPEKRLQSQNLEFSYLKKLGPNLLKRLNFHWKSLLLPDGKSAGSVRFSTSMAVDSTADLVMPIQTSLPCFFLSILRNAMAYQSLRAGQMAHAMIIRSGFGSDLVISNVLLHLYFTCGSMSSGLLLFDEMLVRDVVSWNTVVTGFVGMGCWHEGLDFFRRMKRAGVSGTVPTFASVLVAAGEEGFLTKCQAVHGEIIKLGYSFYCNAGNAVMNAYIKCSWGGEARKVFDEMSDLDEVSFEILLRGYTQDGKSTQAFELFRYSCLNKVCLSDFAVSGLISACASVESMYQGIQIHGFITKSGFILHNSVVNALITMYAKCYQLEESEDLFNGLRNHDIVSWNSLISGYAFCDLGDLGMGIISQFLSCGLSMNDSTFASFLSCSTSVTDLNTAKMVHGLIIKLRGTVDILTDNILLTMYRSCRSLSYSKILFKSMEDKNGVSYNLLVRLLRDQGLFEEAIEVFSAIHFNKFTEVYESLLSNVISSCSRLAFVDMGKQIHCCAMKCGFDTLLHIQNSLLELYAICGELKEMEKIFGEIDSPDLFSWNMVILGYSHSGLSDVAINVWHNMNEKGIQLNEFSYSALIDLCDSVRYLASGAQLQAHIYKLGLAFDTALMNSLLSMYANCGMMKEASVVFSEINPVDSISWNAMISGYAQNRLSRDSIEYYFLMNEHGLQPNYMTFLSICKLCAMLADASLGSQFHGQVLRRGLEFETSISNSFITLYSKSGLIGDSTKIFQTTKCKDLISWNSMINAYSCHGFVKESLETFSQMKKTGIKPTAVTFIGILSACSRAGLVSQAWDHYNSMYKDHGIAPGEEHYTCMVDVLCRKGQLNEAKKFIERMPFEPNELIWRSLLSACRQYGNISLGEEAAKRMMQKDSHDSTAYVLLSDIYASLEEREVKAELRKMMGNRGVRKEVGYSWVRSCNAIASQ